MSDHLVDRLHTYYNGGYTINSLMSQRTDCPHGHAVLWHESMLFIPDFHADGVHKHNPLGLAGFGRPITSDSGHHAATFPQGRITLTWVTRNRNHQPPLNPRCCRQASVLTKVRARWLGVDIESWLRST
jgi:hypothetical protein